MMIPEDTLKMLGGIQIMNVNSLMAKGIIEDDKHLLGGYRSLAEKLNAEELNAKNPSKKERVEHRRELRLREQAKKSNNS